MSFQIEMPQLSAEGESATLASWLVEAGDHVEAGEVIAELETDKSTVELEAPVAGTIAELTVSAGTEGLAPGTLLGIIEAEGKAEGEEKAAVPARDEVSDTAAVSPPGSPGSKEAPRVSPPSPTSMPPGDPASTPLARRVAAQRGLDLAGVAGSGAHGRILEADVLGKADSRSAAPSLDRNGAPSSKTAALPEERPHSSEHTGEMRPTIARRVAASKQPVSPFYLSVRCRMDEVERTRAHLNERLPPLEATSEASERKADAAANGDPGLSINDFVVKAAALAMRDVPAANVCFDGEAIRAFEGVDVAVAVAIDGGLVTRVVRDADRKGLVALSAEIRDPAEPAREEGISHAPSQGGMLTISNLGLHGIETVYPVLEPPQACILGVGAAEEQPIVIAGQVVIGRVAVLTLAADHRAIDGAVGAQWLAAVRRHLEDPAGMML